MDTLKTVVERAYPIWKQVEPRLLQAYPYAVEAYRKSELFYQKASPYFTGQVVDLCYACVLLFFGGHFALSIACYQAFRVAGWNQVKVSVASLKESYSQAVTKLRTDPRAAELLDSDGDGKISMREIAQAVHLCCVAKTETEKDKSRQTVVLLMRCVDPNKILDAFAGFWTGVVAGLATLRSSMAQAVSVGLQISNRICETVTFHLQPYLYKKFPQDTKWVDAGLRAACVLVGVSISFLLLRVVSAFNAALQGAHTLTRFALDALAERNIIEATPVDTRAGQTVVWSITAVGFLWQISSAFTLHWSLRLLLFPFLFCESILSVVAFSG